MADPVDVNWQAIVAKGVEMRAAQREYFQTRTAGAMIRAKELEREFDRMAGNGAASAGRTLFTSSDDKGAA